MLKKTTPIIVSAALALGSTIALADPSTVEQGKKVQQKTTAPQNVSQPSQIAPKPDTIENSQAEKASQKIKLTTDRKLIQRKGPGHVA